MAGNGKWYQVDEGKILSGGGGLPGNSVNTQWSEVRAQISAMPSCVMSVHDIRCDAAWSEKAFSLQSNQSICQLPNYPEPF